MKHVMLYLETLATTHDAAILSIGAVKFDPLADDVPLPWTGGRSFLATIDLDDMLGVNGGRVDRRTTLLARRVRRRYGLALGCTQSLPCVVYKFDGRLWWLPYLVPRPRLRRSDHGALVPQAWSNFPGRLPELPRHADALRLNARPRHGPAAGGVRQAPPGLGCVAPGADGPEGLREAGGEVVTLGRTVYSKGPFTVEKCGGAPTPWTPLLYLVVRDGRRVNAFLKFRRAVNYVKRETAL